MDAQYEKPDFIADAMGRITQYEMPDFLADEMGRVEDVRHLKFPQPEAFQAHRASAAAGGPNDKGGPDYSWPMQSLGPRAVLIPIPFGLLALLGWLVLKLFAGAGP
jgi:hypothetical protein